MDLCDFHGKSIFYQYSTYFFLTAPPLNYLRIVYDQDGDLITSEDIPIDALYVDYFMHKRICEKRVHEIIMKNTTVIWKNICSMISSRIRSFYKPKNGKEKFSLHTKMLFEKLSLACFFVFMLE